MRKLFICLSIILLLFFVSVFALIFFSPKPDLLKGISFSRAVYDSNGTLMRLTLSSDEKFRLYTPLGQISPTLIEATLLQEDRHFYHHIGINPWAILKAGWQTFILHSRRMGASTITMQVARMRYGIHSKSAPGKIVQIYRALQLERHYSKADILEAYLNLAPYGGNIEGAGAASVVYFSQPVSKLSLPNVLALTVIPQNPAKRTPKNQYLLSQARQKLYRRWLEHHPEDSKQAAAIQLPLAMNSPAQLPFLAPHFVNDVLRITPVNQTAVRTSLDLRIQKTIERITNNYLKRHNRLGAYNAAVLLVDTRDMGIKSLLGSANFFNRQIEGQINGTGIKRSPGSTLKPFVYALALDQGLIHPNTVLKDVASSFGAYNPENFDYDFMGPVKAKDALALSRNIPAITLANQLGDNDLYHLLENANIRSLKPRSYYGLAITLGGAELTMKELTSLYAALVNDGVWHPLHYLANEPGSDGTRLLSPEASFLVLDMIAEPSSGNHPVSWKTGTSSGYRDAWTSGTFGPYVLTVWLGNFNSKSNHAFVGKNIAAPLFFEIIEGVEHEHGPLPTNKKNPHSMNLTRVEVCKASGLLPTPYCRDTEFTWFIPGKSPIKTDTIFREVAINPETGLRTCHIDQNTRFEIFEFWPSDLLKIFKQAGIQRRVPPFFEKDCALANHNSFPPQIASLQKEYNYIIRADSKEQTQIPLTAVTDAGVRTLYWFVNGSFLGQINRDQPLLWNAVPGKFMVRVVDDHGLADMREIEVKIDT
ncbi:penicillin-binding protein 1C [Legionella dresdenensis]|uniref:peptidoglycan glycosyltransferase n=1 Tax=Legionella dresdenensis TaxID=450200 RepID=A0ABV8CBS4_9GAMM